MATRYTIAQLVTQADASLPNNTAQEISPTDVRDMVKNFLGTMKPSFASMRRDASLVLALTAVPVIIMPWSVAPFQDSPETVANLAAGTITKQVTSLGNASATDRITFYIGVSGTAGAELTFQLFLNGVATDMVGRVSTDGAGNVVMAALTGLSQHSSDAVYTVRVAASNNASYTFTNGNFRVENVPEAA